MAAIMKIKVTKGRDSYFYYDGFCLAGGSANVTKSEVACSRSGVASCLNILSNDYVITGE